MLPPPRARGGVVECSPRLVGSATNYTIVWEGREAENVAKTSRAALCGIT